MQPIPTKKAEKLLKENGYKFERQTGSHMTFKNNDGKTVTLVNTREQAPGTWRNILKTAGLK